MQPESAYPYAGGQGLYAGFAGAQFNGVPFPQNNTHAYFNPGFGFRNVNNQQPMAGPQPSGQCYHQSGLGIPLESSSPPKPGFFGSAAGAEGAETEDEIARNIDLIISEAPVQRARGRGRAGSDTSSEGEAVLGETKPGAVRIIDNYFSASSPRAVDTEPKPRVKKPLIGPENNQIEFERILYAEEMGDDEVLRQTTLMIRNIPIKFSQADMLELVDEKFEGQYDYFYLPKDVKTQCGLGFAFINMIHPMFILDFFLEFNCIKWSEKVAKCNSNKYCEITYANV